MDQKRFAFGKNWQRYLDSGFNEQTLVKSREYLASFLKQSDLSGLTFVDIGSGSGVHSLAAFQLGARVTSIDVDADSVTCCRGLAAEHQSSDWSVAQGSIIDDEFVGSLGQFDIVYCWGVAHHTGNMALALKNLGHLTKPGGLLYVAIYNDVPGRRGSRMWQTIKKYYNDSGVLMKKLMEWGYITLKFLGILIRLKNPFREIKNYYHKRGMRWTIDLIDWLGGYPYEYAKPEEIFAFYQDQGMELINLKTTNHIGCNQFLFKKK